MQAPLDAVALEGKQRLKMQECANKTPAATVCKSLCALGGAASALVVLASHIAFREPHRQAYLPPQVFDVFEDVSLMYDKRSRGAWSQGHYVDGRPVVEVWPSVHLDGFAGLRGLNMRILQHVKAGQRRCEKQAVVIVVGQTPLSLAEVENQPRMSRSSYFTDKKDSNTSDKRRDGRGTMQMMIWLEDY